MSEITFARDEVKNPSVPVTAAAPVEAATSIAVACPTPVMAVAPIESAQPATKPLNFSDIILPRLNVVQSIGPLSESFTPGSVVFDQKLELYHPPQFNKQSNTITHPGTPPLVIVCLEFRPTRYAEKVAGGGRGMLVNTEAEVRAAGGTLDWSEHQLKAASGMKRFEELEEGLFLIERPEHVADDDGTFVYAVEGKKYALALWALKSTSRTAACKKVFFREKVMGVLRGGYPTHSFSLATRLETFKGSTNTAQVPVLLPLHKTSAELLEFSRSVLIGA